ncbi:MAG: hypothetical protein ACRDTG_19990 [Pseudonocardiaceae bacterium]
MTVQVPAGAELLAFRPWELAHVGGEPLAARGDVTLVYDLPGANRCDEGAGGCCAADAGGIQPAHSDVGVGVAPGTL